MGLSHIDDSGQPTMVDVSEKSRSARVAVAEARVLLPEPVRAAIDGNELRSAKGPVFQTAIIAGVMAAKKTHELIPFCHPLGLERCDVDIQLTTDEAIVQCTVGVTHKTGVEMEALTGASVAALTIYDMCKALSHDMVISQTRLLHKRGGKGDFNAE